MVDVNKTVAPTDIDFAPATAAGSDPSDNAGFGTVTNPGTGLRGLAQRANIADDHCCAVRAEQIDEHPALHTVRILNLAPILIDFDDANRQSCALV